MPSKTDCPLSIAAQTGYPEFVHALLSDETKRMYYLNQIITKPKLMQEAFIKKPIFFSELAAYRNELWERLREPERFHLTEVADRKLLNDILNSS